MIIEFQGKRYKVRYAIKRGTCDLCDLMEDCQAITKDMGHFPCFGLESNAYLKEVKK